MPLLDATRGRLVAVAAAGAALAFVYRCRRQPRSLTLATSASREARDVKGAADVIIVPGFGRGPEDYEGLVAALANRGSSAIVAPIGRRSWYRAMMGLLDPAFWKSEQRVDGLAWGWAVERIHAAILANAVDGRRVTVIAHSAGGFLSRAAIGADDVRGKVERLITLGSVQFTAQGATADQTRGALDHVERFYPGAFVPGVDYVSVAGKGVVGDEVTEPRAFEIYRALTGIASGVVGDGVIPHELALLDGSRQISLPDV
eukprot:CAMPEP_0119293712 /NCGR_PEP_ID=MMETSP1329-20130426/46580_1 /TAXON_ID=114041 /ORGANISM="Genus nov. species nov., Strain RCC1024" /LENGTH=258 /DNA_ID=CAMNT_0007294585 /DNA_START=77 /DNA_END=849 /DNA_ORIENTATION=-